MGLSLPEYAEPGEEALHVATVTILDDYQQVALSSADWSAVMG
jgi:hypothetical protein